MALFQPNTREKTVAKKNKYFFEKESDCDATIMN